MKTYVITLSKVFPSTHKRAGEPTGFRESFREGKLHTIRANYDLWRKRFDEIQAGKACLAVRQWQGRPYLSKQDEIAVLTAADGIGIEKMKMHNRFDIVVYGKRFNMSPEPMNVANNDGLTYNDWWEWFKGYDLSKPMAIIHFTKFRYNNE